jgi:thermitase
MAMTFLTDSGTPDGRRGPGRGDLPGRKSAARLVWRLLAGSVLIAFLVACGSMQAGPSPVQDGPAGGPSYLVTVPLQAGESGETAAARYGGELLFWEPGDFAVLGVDSIDGGSGPSMLDAGAVVEPNWSVVSGQGAGIEMQGLSTIWAGGQSTVWAGGLSTIWGGGLSVLWGGGEYTWMPGNTAIWKKIRLQEAQAIATNLGLGVTVAVIDTGVDLQHPALKESLVDTGDMYDFYDDDDRPQEEGDPGDAGFGHGSNVAGIVRQVAPRATIMPLRVLGPDGVGDAADLASAIYWAVEHGADVINLSLGGAQPMEAVLRAIRVASSRGILVTASSGDSDDREVTYPASKAHAGTWAWQVVSLTGLDLHDRKTATANYSRVEVELAAPAENVYGPYPGLGMAAWSGTSMATAIAAGSLALALGEREYLAVPESRLSDELRATSDDIYSSGQNGEYEGQLGDGRINLETFIERVARPGEGGS